jgi:ketosteroid isomerase-like protein
MAPDVEFDGSSAQAEWRGVYRGRDEVKRFWQAFNEPWESVRAEIEEIIPAPSDAVVTRQTAYFRGRDGIEVTNHTHFVFQFQNGVVVRWLFFNDFADALAAAGLSASA